jgi:hypothetical protein
MAQVCALDGLQVALKAQQHARSGRNGRCSLPKEYATSSMVEKLMKKRMEPERAQNNSFDMEWPLVGFPVTK